MSEPLTIIVPGTPIGKGRPRFVRKTGIAYTPDKTRSYEAVLRSEAALAMRGALPIEGPISISLVATFPIPQSWSKRKKDMARAGMLCPTGRPDLDNLLKCLDALNQIVWRDDAQIVHAQISKRYGDKPELWIRVEPLGVAFADKRSAA